MLRDDKITFLVSVFVSLIAIIAIVLFFLAPKETGGKTFLALSSYSGTMQNGFINFDFVLAGEGNGKYSVQYLLGTDVLDSEELTVLPGESFVFSKTLLSPDKTPLLPLKLTIKAVGSGGNEYSVWFWLNEARVD